MDPEVYRPRSVRFLRHVTVRGWRLKVYGITPHGQTLREALVTGALAMAEAALPETTGPDGGGFGFVVAHDAPDLSYVLVHWWVGGNEIHQAMFSAPSLDPTRLEPHRSAAIGCVWELSVVDFERRGWIEHVLAAPAEPDLDAYARGVFNGDV